MTSFSVRLIDWQPWIAPGLLVAEGIIAGLLVEFLLIRASRRVLKDDSWLSQENAERLLRGAVSGLFTLEGIYLATFQLPMIEASVLLVIRKVLFVLGAFIVIRLTANVLLEMLSRYTKQVSIVANLPNTSIFDNLVRSGVFLVGALVILQTLGVSILPILTALGVGGLAVSLALKETLDNLFAGINMLMARQIQVGDVIQLENGQSGTVEDIAWRTTSLRQFSGNLIIVPNSKMASNIIINHTMPHPDLTVTLSLALAPDNDLQKIETIAMAVGEAVGTRLLQEKNPRKKPEAVTPVVRYRAPGESWINLNLSLPFKTVLDAGWVRHELLKALLIRFNEENINLAFPQHIVHIREGSLGGGNEPPESVAAAK